MARGNRGASGTEDTEIIYVRLPLGLVYITDQLQNNMRCTSRSEVVRRLLETHPWVLAELSKLEYTGEDTSPKTEQIGTPS